LLLRERGIKLTEESRAEPGAFSSSMSAEVVSASQEKFVASGTLFGNDMPRLVRLGDFRLEAYLDGNLLVFMHSDVPGIIGAVGTIFGNHGVNIAQMSVGRAAPGGGAIGVLNLDSVPPQAALAEVSALKAVQTLRIIQLPKSDQLPSWLR
jgi:D-3-phosphoglycerate dehydrogenase